MSDIKDILIDGLLPILVTLLIAVLAWAGKALADLLREHAKTASTRRTIDRVYEVVWQVVLELEQTEVALLKASLGEGSDGGRRITPAEAKQLGAVALEKVKAFMGPRGVQELLYILGATDSRAVDRFISSRIEATVLESKGGATHIPSAIIVPAAGGDVAVDTLRPDAVVGGEW